MSSLSRIADALEQLLDTGKRIIEQQRAIEAQNQELVRSLDAAYRGFTAVTSNHERLNRWMADHQAHCETWHAKALQAMATQGRQQ